MAQAASALDRLRHRLDIYILARLRAESEQDPELRQRLLQEARRRWRQYLTLRTELEGVLGVDLAPDSYREWRERQESAA